MRFIVFVLIIILLLAILSKLSTHYYKDKINHTLKINNATLDIEIADNDQERTQGLSGKENLEENSGLLFVFEKEGDYGIWMKDMNFPIDIAWLDKNKKIVHIEKNISPETYPKIFNSETPNLFVLETPANFFAQNNIKIGDFVDF